MTRGKYAARSALRREDASVQSEISGYQHHVKRLTAESQELKDALATERAARKEEVRRLKAQLDEGLSPELLALRDELRRQRDRVTQADAARNSVQEKHNKLFTFSSKLLHDLTGCTGLEASEAIVDAIFGGEGYRIGAEVGASLPMDRVPEAVALQRTRGLRSSAKVQEHLKAVCRQAAERESTGDRKKDRWREAR